MHEDRRERICSPGSQSNISTVSVCTEDLDEMPPFEGGKLGAVAFDVTTVAVLGKKST